MAVALKDAWFDGERRLTASEAVCQLLQTTPILPGCMEVEFQIREHSRWGFVFTVLQRLRSSASAEHGTVLALVLAVTVAKQKIALLWLLVSVCRREEGFKQMERRRHRHGMTCFEVSPNGQRICATTKFSCCLIMFHLALLRIPSLKLRT